MKKLLLFLPLFFTGCKAELIDQGTVISVHDRRTITVSYEITVACGGRIYGSVSDSWFAVGQSVLVYKKYGDIVFRAAR